jgi:predicted hydrolase (HD superfamily)
MDKTLFAVDELSGLLTAAALVQPEKTIHTVTVKSVKKKMKDKAFARSVNRDDIRKGTAELGIGLDEHLEFCIEALKNVAAKLGLDFPTH